MVRTPVSPSGMRGMISPNRSAHSLNTSFELVSGTLPTRSTFLLREFGGHFFLPTSRGFSHRNPSDQGALRKEG